MQFSPSSRLGPFEIVAAIGAGGMGEVYQAVDTRLDRRVAIKVLARELGSSVSVRERFDREARAVSQLAHPHICTLFDIGHDNGTDYLVMEFLEGETLAERIRKGPLSLDEVLEYGAQLADALDKAHRQGIVHRDLKPGNVMLTREGTKLLDFGLAKLSIRHQQPLGGLTSLPTEQKNLTQEGTILGTFQYMAPEQLEGIEADTRTDIFAFGALLYEMTTGRRAFEGKTKTSLIAAIVDREPPPISTLQPLTPPALEYLIRKCLEKDPERRWQSAADIATQLRWISEGGSQVGVAAPVVSRRKNRERLTWGLVAAAAAASMTFAALWWRASARPRPRAELALTAPAQQQFAFTARGEGIALSPDGTQIVFVAQGKQGAPQLYLRPLRTSIAQPLPGTERAVSPFFSHDGRYVGFFADGKLKKIALAGGPPQPVTDASGAGGYRGGTWNRDDVILFSPNARSVIFKVSANGGAATEITKLDRTRGEFSHRFPWFLPDGDHFLYLARTGPVAADIRIASLSGKTNKLLLAANSAAWYAEPGYVLFVRDRVLLAQRFDADSHELSPDSIPIAESVQFYPNAAHAIVAASSAGVIAYQQGTGSLETQLTWVDRNGKPIGEAGPPRQHRSMRLSHDGKRLAVTLRDVQTGNDDVWVLELSRGTATRLTFDPLIDDVPVWSADDHEIVFSSEQGNRSTRSLMVRKSNGDGTASSILSGDALNFPSDVSPDGNWIAFDSMDLNSRSGFDVKAVSRRDRTVTSLASSSYDERFGRFSPDGKWIAYASGESGRNEIYVQQWPPAGGGKWQVSVGGGEVARWRKDGKEIFYYTDGKLMAVPVHAGSTFEAGQPGQLFETTLPSPSAWEVSGDGQRLLLNRPLREEIAHPITVVLNWAEGLKK